MARKKEEKIEWGDMIVAVVVLAFIFSAFHFIIKYW